MRFSEKVCVVIGGNSGIGLGTARQMANEGGRVIITGRNVDTLTRAKAEIGAELAESFDVTDLDAIDRFYAKVKAQFGRIDALVVSAGKAVYYNVRDVTPDIWDRTMAVNMRGAFFVAQKALPLMGKGGAIVLVGSIGGVGGMANNVVYGSSKAGLRHMARAMARDLVADGIRVNNVAAGPIDTPLVTRTEGVGPEQVEGAREMLASLVPMGRIGSTEEAGKAICFLASDDASFITGIDLYVDGGSLEIS